MDTIPQTFDEFYNFADRKDPYYFGLGFIKCRLSDTTSMNFYDPELVILAGPEELHDHRYDFTSKIIAGNFTNEIYQCLPINKDDSSHAMFDAICVETEEMDLEPIFYTNPTLLASLILSEGSEYFIEKDTFHKVAAPDGAITYLTRNSIVKKTARVAKPHNNITHTCLFSKKINKDELFGRIETLFKTLK